MKKFLTVMLTMLLGIIAAAMLVTSASAAQSTYTSKNRNIVDRMDEYQGYTTGYPNAAKKNELNFFDSANSALWVKNAGLSFPSQADGTATMIPASTTGHAFKNFQAGYGTFEFKFNVQVNTDNEYSTDMFQSSNLNNLPSTFFGIIFMQSVNVTNVNAILSPWTTHYGYPYMLTFDCEQGPDNEMNRAGTLADGSEATEGRLIQTGLTLRRYPYGGSHNYTRWSTVAPTDATYVTSIPNYYESKIPAYAREVRVEDIWDGADHTMTCQFVPLYSDNLDGTDAMLIEVYFDGVLVLRVYDNMPFEDVEQRQETFVDKRYEQAKGGKGNGYVTLWTHNTFSNASLDSENYRVNIQSFKIFNYGATEDYTGTKPLQTDITCNDYNNQYNGSAYTLRPNGTFAGKMFQFYDEDGNQIAGIRYDANGDPMPGYTFKDAGGNEVPSPVFPNSGEYKVLFRSLQRNFEPYERWVTVSITKARAAMNVETYQTKDYDEDDPVLQEITASITRGDNTLQYSPSKGFVDEGVYTIVVWAEETTNYLAIAARQVTFVIGPPPPEKDDLVIGTMKLSDLNVTYNGKEHCVWVENLRPTVTVRYIDNVQINAGTYEVTAILSEEGFKDATLTATITIAKAELTINAKAVQEFNYANKAFRAYGITSNGDIVYSEVTRTDIGETTVTLTFESMNYKKVEVQVTIKVKSAI